MLAKHIAPLMSALVLAAAASLSSAALADDEDVVLYKNPNCGCCGKWADHMREAGFSVREVSTQQMNIVRDEAGVPRELGSCHTALIDGYVVEGHVPASDVRRLLEERPLVSGISVPGMPLGSPGMEGPYEPESYEVLTFGGIEGTQVFSRH